MMQRSFSAQVWLLADDLASCAYSPPLMPTMKAVLRVLQVAQNAVTSSQMYELVPCSPEAIRSQLSRLRAAGWVEVVRRERGGARVFYRLTDAGRRVVDEWGADVVRAAERIGRSSLSVGMDLPECERW